ncbi:MAG TPA: hypothetical protein VMH31_16245 [Methylomirabilota bacterium]|nr:hypothetical protein [Methylomirabilota bacterium]
MKKLGIVMMFAVMVGVADAADKAGNEALERWVGGTWPLEGKMVKTDYSEETTVTGVSKCGWSPEHIFMLCDQSLTVNGKPDRDLSVYVYDAESGKFHFYGLSPKGDRPRSTDLVISADGKHWEYQSTAEIKDKKVKFRTINEFRNPDYIEWWSEFSTDEGQHWTKMGGGSEKRAK